MGFVCHGICTRYIARKHQVNGRYATRQKRCSICEIYIKWQGIWCPCCGTKLRITPHSRGGKEKFRKFKQSVNQVFQYAVPSP